MGARDAKTSYVGACGPIRPRYSVFLRDLGSRVFLRSRLGSESSSSIQMLDESLRPKSIENLYCSKETLSVNTPYQTIVVT